MRIHQIVITGFMGSGKTAVARALARILKCEALDLDEVITQRQQRRPKEIIQNDGEAAFREIETQTLRRILDEARERDVAHVIALGGGTWTLERNRDIVQRNNCYTVWLDVPFDRCWKRILAAGDESPLARNEDEARALYGERLDSYRRADFHVKPSDNTSAEHVANEVAQALSLTEVESSRNEKRTSE